jgi:hypothetical protein
VSAPARLALFAVAVAIAFGLGFGVGDAAGPFGEQPSAPPAVHGEHDAG